MRSLLGFGMAVAQCAAVCSISAASEPAPAYKITKTVALGAPDEWDYVVFDSATDRVFVAHGSEVAVVNGRDGTLLGNISEIPGGTHGIGISTAAGRGYTDDGAAGVAVSFDLKTLKTQSKIPAAPDADGISFDPASAHIFVINGDSGSLTVIDPKTDSAITTIDVGGGLEFGAADGKGKFYVDGADKGELVRIDTASNKVDARWPIPKCVSPHGLAVDPVTRRVFSSCPNGVLAVTDADTGKAIASLPIGRYTDADAFDPVRKLIFSSNADGTLSIVRENGPNEFVSLGNIKTFVSARTMSLDPATGRLYLAGMNVTKVNPPKEPGGHPSLEYAPGSLKLVFLDPAP